MKEIGPLLLLLIVTACGGGPGVETGRVLEVKSATIFEIPSNINDPDSVEIDLSLLGIQSPHHADKSLARAFFGVLAEEWVDDWVEDRDLAVKNPLQKNGNPVRSSGWLWDPIEDVFLHRLLVKEGFAEVEVLAIPEEFAEERKLLKRLENEARGAGRGMWRAKIPSYHEIRKMVDAANGPFGRIVRSSTDPTNLQAQPNPLVNGEPEPIKPKPIKSKPIKLEPKKPEPVTPEPAVVTSLQSDSLVRTLDRDIRAIRREHLKWLLSDKTTRGERRDIVWNRMRAAKIRLMDALDERDDLSTTQRKYLSDLRADLNRLMKEMAR